MHCTYPYCMKLWGGCHTGCSHRLVFKIMALMPRGISRPPIVSRILAFTSR